MSAATRFVVLITGSAFPDKEPETAELAGVARVVIDESSSRSDLLKLAADVDAILVDGTRIDAALIEAAPKLKAVVAYGVGTDNIDLQAARRRGVVVANSPEGISTEVAEHAMGLLFALARQIFLASQDVRFDRMWDGFSPTYQPMRLKDKTLGVVGFGRTGRESGRIAAGIGMDLLAYDPHIDRGSLNLPFISKLRFCDGLDALLGVADAVTMHVPLTDETRGMMGREQFRRMKRGAFFVNVSRGPVVDQAALREALADGYLAGAALDVFTPEPPKWDEALIKERNLILTPHMAWRSEGSARRMQQDAASEARRILLGQQPKWRVA